MIKFKKNFITIRNLVFFFFYRTYFDNIVAIDSLLENIMVR